MIIDTYNYTNVGGREVNEDSVNLKTDGKNGIFVVADGLGGYDRGEQASKCVTSILTEAWTQNCTDRPAWFSEKIAAVNSTILSMQKTAGSNMKSTVVALSVDGNQATWAHTGDSRLYYLHNNTLYAVTADHSVAYMKYKAGEIERKDINNDPDQSCLLKALGNPSRWEPEILSRPVEIYAGDAFLLCSDGLWEYLYDEEVVIDFLKSKNAQQWGEYLLCRAMARMHPGNDNFTMLTVIMQPQQGDRTAPPSQRPVMRRKKGQMQTPMAEKSAGEKNMGQNAAARRKIPVVIPILCVAAAVILGVCIWLISKPDTATVIPTVSPEISAEPAPLTEEEKTAEYAMTEPSAEVEEAETENVSAEEVSAAEDAKTKDPVLTEESVAEKTADVPTVAVFEDEKTKNGQTEAAETAGILTADTGTDQEMPASVSD